VKKAAASAAPQRMARRRGRSWLLLGRSSMAPSQVRVPGQGEGHFR
jgi:hypothetical protein